MVFGPAHVTIPTSIDPKGIKMTASTVRTVAASTALTIVTLAGLTLLGVTLPAGTAAAQSTDPGFYVGVNYVQINNDAQRPPYDQLRDFIYDAGLDFAPSTSSVRFDSKDSGYGIIGGYRFGPHWALEGGYLDLGNVEYRDSSTGVFRQTGETESWNLNFDSKTSGLSLSALGILPITYRTELYVRGGALFATNKLNYFASNGSLIDVDAESKSKVNLLAGAGLSLGFLEIYSLRLEYLRVFDVGQDLTGQADIDIYSLGMTVRF